nr:immunoglobulin heavy chain junction region [Mus musculus]NSM05035.1 immunoglobulin heavy chain junction region [Mus musculus]NSM05939.1 immunoglobulin heavy chain junction region [Mus musculus]NSM06624.1 immunoglobulin heavy chain junction region [Mus musculus]NSM06855.1 immunoglobulin heavy chain junction region [Mus musculus]
CARAGLYAMDYW